MRIGVGVIVAVGVVFAAVAAGPACDEDVPDGGADEAADAAADEVGDASEADAEQDVVCSEATRYAPCEGSVMDGRCRAYYDPGCPPCLPLSGSACSVPMHCDYCHRSSSPALRPTRIGRNGLCFGRAADTEVGS